MKHIIALALCLASMNAWATDVSYYQASHPYFICQYRYNESYYAQMNACYAGLPDCAAPQNEEEQSICEALYQWGPERYCNNIAEHWSQVTYVSCVSEETRRRMIGKYK